MAQISVVSGEASESSDDDNFSSSTPTNTGVIVMGEASESDDEAPSSLPSAPITTKLVTALDDGTKRSTLELKLPPKYKGLLYKKLREKNLALRNNWKKTLSNAYSHSAVEVRNMTTRTLHAHSLAQDAKRNMHLVRNNISSLRDKLDIVTSCMILPDIDTAKLDDVENKS